MKEYNPNKIEPKWQKKWEKLDLSKAEEVKAEKAYILDMFPYPSSEGLHTGHVESYTATDIISRYLRMKGKNVLHPQGWDAFGLPAENFAIKTKTHPAITTQRAIENYKRQMNMLGFSYDWSREINSSESNYYKWTQWFFLLLYKNGLAYKGKAKVNWCNSCQTVLANEQVENGACERCKKEVIQKDKEQWFFRITDFIESSFAMASDGQGQRKTSGLISGLEKIDWPESTKATQRNWIGKSEGVIVKFKIFSTTPVFGHPFASDEVELANAAADEGKGDVLEIFTTRLDTIFGCTYCVVAPEHEIISKIKNKISNIKDIERYISESKKKSELARKEAKEKTGVELKGIKVINPFNKEEVPVFVADYVLANYGTGAVMAVPSHDERDWEFAKKFKLPIKQVIAISAKEKIENAERRDGAIALIQNKEKILVLYDNLVKTYNFPRGGVEEGETLERAVIREACEETGYQNLEFVENLGCIESYFWAPDKKVNRHRFSHGFLLKLKNNQNGDQHNEDKNRYDVHWLSFQDAREKLKFSEDKIFLERIINRKKICFVDDGTLINSSDFDGLTSEQAREEMTKWLKKNKLGAKKVNYKLHDWLISRQRYWGAPIPIIYCEKCGEIPVPENDLPVELPDDVDFMPTGESPLIRSKKFHNVKCPKCGEKAKRESDTMDTFVCSSWYYFRYADPKNTKEFASKKAIKKWLPVDLYVGGAEHVVLHLLYSRFFTKALHHLGYINFDEPFLKLRHQGMILAEDGQKMSKSLGNVVNPDEIVKRFGADALRMYEMFMGPLEDAKPWNTNGIIGICRFLERTYNYICGGFVHSPFHDEKTLKQWINGDIKGSTSSEIRILLNKTIKKVSEDIENLKFNTAISQLMVLRNSFYKVEEPESIPLSGLSSKTKIWSEWGIAIEKPDFKKFLILLSPFAPHIAEELWEKLGHKESIFLEKWPEYDFELIKEEIFELVAQINGKVRDRIEAKIGISENEAKEIVLAREQIKKWIKGKEIKKIIFVKDRLINIII